MADARDNHKEAERRSNETESRSIEDLGFGTKEIGRIYYYNESHEEIRQCLQQQRLIDVEMQRRSHERESRSIEEPNGGGNHPNQILSGNRYFSAVEWIIMMKPESIQISQENKDLGFETNEIGRIYYYNESHEEIRQYLQQQRLIDVEMQRRSDETESRSIEEPKLPTPDMRLSDSGRRSDERTDGIQKREPSSLPEKKDKEDSVLRITEADQIRDYKHSNADTRENLQQYRRLRDVEMQRRRRETESRFWHQERERYPDRRGSESRLRFDERAPDWRESAPRLRFDERTPDWRGSESQWIFDEKTQRRQELVRSGEECWCRQCCNGRSCRYNYPTQLSQARSTDWRASESEWRFDERTQRRYEREYSGFRPKKRLLVHSQSKIIPDSLRDPRRHDTEWRFERERMEQIERQRREARYNLQEQRSRGEVKDYSHLIDPIVRGNMQARREAQVREQRQRDSIERQRREAQENLQQDLILFLHREARESKRRCSSSTEYAGTRV